MADLSNYQSYRFNQCSSEFPTTTGIYALWNTQNNKLLVGQTLMKEGMRKRWEAYRVNLRANRYSNPHLQAAYNQYGENAFRFVLIEETCNGTVLNSLEIHYINEWNTINAKHGYNIREGGNNGGKLHEETKRKISVANKGRVHTEQARRNMKLSKQNVSEVTRKKHSVNSKSAENIKHCKRMSALVAKEYMLVSPNGEIITGKNISALAREYGLLSSGLAKVVSGKLKSCNGWTRAGAPAMPDSVALAA